MTKIVDIPILAKAKEYRENLKTTFIFGNEYMDINDDLYNLSDAELVKWYQSLHHDDTKK
jgi:hypothetical protein